MLYGVDTCCVYVKEGEDDIVLFDEALFLAINKSKSILLNLQDLQELQKVQGVKGVQEVQMDKEKDMKVGYQFLSKRSNDVDVFCKSLLRTQSFSTYLTSIVVVKNKLNSKI